MKSLDEFRKFFDTEMMSDLELLENRRKEIIRKSIRVALFAILAIVALILIYRTIGVRSGNENMGLYFVLAGVLIVIGAIITGTIWARDKTFYTDFKTQVIERIVRFVSPDLVYEPKNFVGSDTFQRSRIFLRSVDRYTGDDMVKGTIDKTQIWFSEVKAEYRETTTDNKGKRKTRWRTIFKGLFFTADFNKHFQTSTVVLPNRLGKGFVANFFNKMNLARKEKHVRLEDPDFNKHFVVYGEDQIEARYVLSTSLMRRITEFKQKHPNPLYISFVNSFLYVAIAYKKDLFEPSYFKKLTRFSLVQEFFEDIHLAVSIVEELNLNNRIWTKQ